MNFPFSDDIRAKIDQYNQLVASAEVDANGVIVVTNEMNTLLGQLKPYVLSPEYTAYLTCKFAEMGIKFSVKME